MSAAAQQQWEELVRTALLGTGRQSAPAAAMAPSPAGAADPLGELTGKLATAGLSPEAVLLGRAVAPLAGTRGRWLAARNPEWAWVGGGAEAGAGNWDTAERPARRLMVRRLRKTDPAGARQLVVTAFPQEAAEERADFVTALEVGLSPDDEPFLESCLDDRAPSVREAARDLLACLTDSRFVARMTALAAGRMAVKTTGKKPKLELIPPPEFDKVMARDGITAPDPKQTDKKAIAERACRQVIDIARVVAPSHWCRETGRPPAELLALIAKHDFESELRQAWASAAERHRDQDWADALLAEPGYRAGGLVAVMRPEERMRRLLAALDADDPDVTSRAGVPVMAGHVEAPWPTDLCDAVLKMLRRVPLDKQVRPWTFQQVFSLAARRMPPETAAAVTQGLPEQAESWPQWRDHFDRLAGTLRFRAEMLAAVRGGH